jgi:hypothetical protein
MRRLLSIEAFALVAPRAGTRPAGTEDKTTLIELERRSEAFTTAVSGSDLHGNAVYRF